jgi:homoserine O-acetyltransferase
MQEKTQMAVTQTQTYTISELTLESGEKLSSVTIAYETYGTLNSTKTNAVLVCHALSGDAHVSGKGGWWSSIVGEGKPIDTNKYFVICSNVLGSCRGSTGPSSINPKTGQNYGLDFPLVSIIDFVNAQRRLIDQLGIGKLLAVVGGSMGGMQVLQWMNAYPDRIRAAVSIATALKHSPQQIAFNEVGRQAIIADPDWNGGNYYGKAAPAKGLAIARMIGHITYMSEASMEKKFGRKTNNTTGQSRFGTGFEVEGYLRSRGDSFVGRFDANSYLYITKAIDAFNLPNGNSNALFKGLKAKVLVVAYKSDWLYNTTQAREIIKACKQSEVDASYCELDAPYGHDSFLVETEQLGRLVEDFLRGVNGKGDQNSEQH